MLSLTVLIPQKEFASPQEIAQFTQKNLLFRAFDYLGLTNIVYSFWFISLILLLFLNVFACFTEQLKKALRRPKRELAFPALVEKIPGYLCFQGKYFPEEKIIAFLKRRGYKLKIDDKGKELTIIAFKGKLHFFGPLLFHFALLIVFIGLTLTTLMRFSGVVELTEGEIAKEGEEGFYAHNFPLVFFGYPPFSLKLVRFKPTFYPDGSFQTVKSIVRLGTSEGVVEKEVSAASPLAYLGHRINQMVVGGVSPQIALLDKNKKLIESVFIPFERGSDLMSPLKGSYQFTRKKISIKGLLYPQAKVKDGKLTLVSYKIQEPVLQLTVKGEKKIQKVQLRLGELVKFDNFFIYFEDARYWARFQIVYDPGAVFTFVGFGFSLFGLIAMYFLTEKIIFVKVERIGRIKAKVHLAGKKSSQVTDFKDLNQISRAIKKWLEVSEL